MKYEMIRYIPKNVHAGSITYRVVGIPWAGSSFGEMFSIVGVASFIDNGRPVVSVEPRTAYIVQARDFELRDDRFVPREVGRIKNMYVSLDHLCTELNVLEDFVSRRAVAYMTSGGNSGIVEVDHAKPYTWSVFVSLANYQKGWTDETT